MTRTSSFPASHVGAEVVPGFVLVEKIGRGGSGEVWAAEGPGGFAAALKFIHMPGGPSEVDLRGLEILRSVRHPNVLSTFGSFLRDDWLILAMERADGSLWDRFRAAVAEGSPGIGAHELVEWLSEAAHGIDYLNQSRHTHDGRDGLGIQHRDIKPQNILLVGGGVKVGDFGAARWMDEVIGGCTGRSFTLEYAAPEFFRGLTSRHSDQYGLAVTYCQLRGGRCPFSGSPAALTAGHLMHEPDLSMIGESERPAVARALAKDPESRWESCRAFLDAIKSDLRSANLPPAPAWVETLKSPRDGREAAEIPAPPPIASDVIAGLLLAEAGDEAPAPARDDPQDPPSRPVPMRPLIAAAVLVGFVGLAGWMGGLAGGAHPEPAASRRPSPRFVAALEPPRRAPLVASEHAEIPEARPEIPAAKGEDRPAAPSFRKSTPSLLETAISRFRPALQELSTVAGSRLERPNRATETTEAPRPRPALPSIGLETPESLDVTAGRPATLPVKVSREGNSDPVEIRFEDAPGDVRSPGTVIAGDCSEAECKVEATSEDANTSVNVRVIATAGPLRAESSVRLNLRPSPALEPRLRGDAYMMRGEFDRAIASYRDATRLVASDAASVLGLARALAASGDADGAVPIFDEAIRLDSSNAQAFKNRGEARQRAGDRDGAIDDFSTALRLRPDDAGALNKRGLLLVAQRQPYKAIADFDEAIRLNPNDAAYHYNRGWVYDRLGDAVEAIAEYDKAIRLAPKLAAAYKARAATHARLGDSARAKVDQDEAARLEKAADPSPAPPTSAAPEQKARY